MESHETSRSQDTWSAHALLLWRRRSWIARATAVALCVGVVISLVLPKRYTAVARIMPPDQQQSSAMMLAALATKTGLGALGPWAGGFLSSHSTTALFIDLLRSSTVTGHLIDRFDLQRVYRKRYRTDTAKRLARNTAVADDRRSGVITLAVQDTDPVRARDLAQAYLDELNKLVVQTNTSAAHSERVFLDQRLQSANTDLERSEVELSEFSSRSGTFDLKEQARAMVDAGARVEGSLLVEEAGLSSLRQVYGDGNVRVRETEAKIASLRRDLAKMSGSPAGATEDPGSGSGQKDVVLELSPALRQLPRLGIAYADLYRRVRVQETVFDLLTQQYELARVEEAKDVPVVSVIDVPGIPERKSFPPRTLLTLALTGLGCVGACIWVLFEDRWRRIDPQDARRLLWAEVAAGVRGWTRRGAR